MGQAIGPSYKPWGGFIIPSLLKRICPQIKVVFKGLQQPKLVSTRIKHISAIVIKQNCIKITYSM